MSSFRQQKYPLAESVKRITHHDNLDFDQVKIGELTDTTHFPISHIFVKQNEHVSILVPRWLGPQQKYRCKQYDFPLRVLSWFPKALEEFRKPPAEGGLHAGAMISKDVDIDGEMLAVGSTTNGYYIINRSRNDHKVSGDIYRPMDLSLEFNFLYNLGFLDLWKELGEKYERGELDYLNNY